MFLLRISLVVLLLFMSNFSVACAQESETAGLVVLKKGAMQISLSRPGDKMNYRGTRFDHSGMIQKIRWGEHQLCERWHVGPSNPDANDDVTGPCEEFGNGAPLGYVPNSPGTNFVKIGVGVLKQPEETQYRFSNVYAFVHRGEWTTKHDESSITYLQRLFDDPAGKSIGYEYEKTIRVTGNGFRIEHLLKNIGTSALSTDHYNHNFFLIDSDKVGPNYELQLPFPINAINRRASFDEITKVVDKTVGFRELVGTRSFFAELTGHRNQISDHQFKLHHIPTGVTIECKGDSPLSKMNFWGMANTICPEPYTQIKLAANSEFRWSLEYSISIMGNR
ncbi:MAG TPA: hypothetical protein VM260_00795 [Pirellula sp.]|nr:hypothetical protein [Pirellula sp.]